MKKILITGGAGFIGSNLVDLFLKRKAYVVVVDNLITGTLKNIDDFKKNSNFKFLKNDVTSINFQEILKGQSFDIIYHLASPASPKQYLKYPQETLLVNSLGTLNLLNFVKKGGAKMLIFASTSEVYGDPKIHPQNESYWGNVNPIGPRSCYDEAKRFGEALCMSFFRKFKIDIRIARIFNTFGSNMEKEDGRVISNFIVQALTGKNLTVFGTGMQTRSFCYISDMISALYLFSQENLKGEIINLGNPDEITILSLAALIKKLANSSNKIEFEPLPQDDPQRRKPDISKASKLLSWSPKVKLEPGLKQSIIYFRERFHL